MAIPEPFENSVVSWRHKFWQCHLSITYLRVFYLEHHGHLVSVLWVNGLTFTPTYKIWHNKSKLNKVFKIEKPKTEWWVNGSGHDPCYYNLRIVNSSGTRITGCVAFKCPQELSKWLISKVKHGIKSLEKKRSQCCKCTCLTDKHYLACSAWY